MDIADKPVILALAGVPDALVERLHERYSVIDSRQGGVRAVAAERLESVVGIACTGRATIGEAELALLPRLAIVSSYSAGLDGIDEDALQCRGVALRHTSHVLAPDVADFAVALLLGLLRGIPQADRFTREGRWPEGAFPLQQSLQGRRVGLLGMGHIGTAIAHRLAAFATPLAYCARAPKPGRPETYCADVVALATWCDVLVVACSANGATRGLVDGRVLEALGPRGFLVNVARGSIVDEPALIGALQEHRIAGAALDVFADEPGVPEALRRIEHVVLTPHLGSATIETRAAMAKAALAALDEHFATTTG